MNFMENWENLSPLDNLERQSIHLIQKKINEKPIQFKSQIIISPNSTRSNSPHSISLLIQNQSNVHRDQSSSSSTSSSSSFQSNAIQNQFNTLSHQPISNIDRFNDWFSIISSQIESDSDSDYLNHLNLLSNHLKSCDSLDNVIEDCKSLLNEIDANWKFVNENSQSIERSCEGMLNDQKVLFGIATALNDRLEYFRKLDYAQKFLSRPGQAQIVNDPEFLPMISRLDVCLEFMKLNRHFRDADLYLVRFQQCLTRSMTLIKLHYTHQIQNLGKQVNEKLNQISQQSSTSTSNNNLNIERSLLYEKFENLSHELSPLITQVEKRFQFDKLEYGDLLNEFFQIWFSVRNMLLNPKIKIEINRIQITHEQVPDLISLTTTGCNYLRSICIAEWKLFKSFFTGTGEEELFAYLESLSDYLYDLLRPQILHEPKLDLLCDLATIMNALIAIDSESMNASAIGQDTSSTFKFSSLLRPILQDVQTRLIFRAQAIIQSDVEHYQPKPLDLDYPNKLMQRSNHHNLDQKSPTKNSSPYEKMKSSYRSDLNRPLKFRLPDEEIQESWYPTLRRTLWVLSQLHTYVNDAIFEDFAGEAVGICSESIIKASKWMKIAPTEEQDNSGKSEMMIEENEWSIDRELFVIRHLLILKEMIRTLEVVQVERAVDLGPIRDVLKEILNPSLKDSLIFRPITLMNKLKNLNSNKPIGQQFTNERAIDHSPVSLLDDVNANGRSLIKTIDRKSELNQKLRYICNSFILKSSALITTTSIDDFLGKCQKTLNFELPSNQDQNVSDSHDDRMTRDGKLKRKNLLNEEWTSKDSILKIFQSFMKDLNVGLKFILNRLSLYFPSTIDDGQDLVDFNLIEVLLPALQEDILEKYSNFFNVIKAELNELELISNLDDHHHINLDDINFDHILFPFQIKSVIHKIVLDLFPSSKF